MSGHGQRQRLCLLSAKSRHLGSEAARLKFRAAPETQHRDRVLLKIEGGIDDELDAWRDLELLG
jgi:hypothetical protein